MECQLTQQPLRLPPSLLPRLLGRQWVTLKSLGLCHLSGGQNGAPGFWLGSGLDLAVADIKKFLTLPLNEIFKMYV